MNIKLLRSSWPQRLLRAFSGLTFYRLIIGIFVFEAAWIALSSHYPMAFDEDFHFGLINIYAHHLNPFLSSQPESANTYGAMFRDPSYLYHYLMSFPYRLISLFTADQTIQILWLRALNIALFTCGIAIFRRVMLNAGVSKALSNSINAVFILIPAFPLLAGQINYDNLIFPLAAIAMLLTLQLNHRLKQSKAVSVSRLTGLVVVSLTASLVKYAFLPIMITLFAYIIVRYIQVFRSIKAIVVVILADWSKLAILIKLLIVASLLLAVVFFSQRYFVNIALYHTPIPDCAKVLNVEACSDYGPWIRDYSLNATKTTVSANPVTYINQWLYGMWLRLFYALDGPTGQFNTKGPLVVPAWTAIVVAVLGGLLFIRYFRQIVRRRGGTVIALLLSVVMFYLLVLWLDEFRAYLRTGQPVAINGRYLLPIIIPAMILLGFAFSEWLRSRLEYKLILASVVILGMMWGGGALTFILRSDNSWYWNNYYVRITNQAVQKYIGPLVPSGTNQQLYLR